jgi:hypothetical protein
MSFKIFFSVVLATTMALGLPVASRAGELPIGYTTLTGTTAASQLELAGSILQDMSTPYDFTGSAEHVKGVVQSRVVRSDLTRTLDFYWRIIPDSTSTGDIYALRMGGYIGALLDANWRIDGLGTVPPQTILNFGSGSVNFLFSPPEQVGPGVGPNDSSMFFFLRTDAIAYDQSGFFDLLSAPSDAMSALYATFAPAVPEPSTAAIVALAFFAVTLAALSKRGCAESKSYRTPSRGT